jgi:hypothetical protein
MTSGVAIQCALVVAVGVAWVLSRWAKKQSPKKQARVLLLVLVVATLVAGREALRRPRTHSWLDVLTVVAIAVLVVQESRRFRRNAVDKF